MTAYTSPGAAMEVVDELRSRFTARDALYEQLNEICFLERKVNIPSAYEKYALTAHSPYPFIACHILTSTITARPFDIQLSPFQQGDAGEANATKREHWHDAAWERAEDDAQRALYFPTVFNLVQKGEGILKTMQRNRRLFQGYYRYSAKLRADLKADKKLTNTQREAKYQKDTDAYKRGELPFPIVTTDVVPESFWYVMGDDGITCAVEALEIPYHRALALFEGGETVDGKAISPAALGLGAPPHQMQDGGGQNLKMFAVWTCDHVTYLVDHVEGNEQFLGKSIAHGYGNKYTRALRGPFFRIEGIPTGRRDLKHAAKGLLWAFMEIFPLIDAAMVGSGQLGFYTAWPWMEQDAAVLGREGGLAPDEAWGDDPAGLSKRTSQEISLKPGQALPPGMHFASVPRNAAELHAFLEYLQYFMEFLVPPVLRGMGEGSGSGYDTNQRIHQGLLSLDMFVKNLQRTLSRREAWIDELITLIGERVYLEHSVRNPYKVRARAEYVGLSPEDVATGRHYHVKIRIDQPGNQALQVKMFMDMKQMGWISDMQVIEQLGENYDEVTRQRKYEEIMASPEVQQMINQQVFQRIGVQNAEMLDATNQRFAGLLGQGYGQPTGGAMGPAQGGVFAPGEGMPMQPTPAGAVNGPSGGLPGNPGGGPAGVMGPPPNSYALPGQGG